MSSRKHNRPTKALARRKNHLQTVARSKDGRLGRLLESNNPSDETEDGGV